MFCFQFTSLLQPDVSLWRQFLAAAVNTLPGGTLQRRRQLTALLGLHLIQSSTKFRYKTLQHQIRLALRFRSRTKTQHCRPKIII